MDFAETHPVLRTYLRYVEHTESPRLFHVWSIVSALSAALGRRCWLPSGIGPIWPNMYIVLCGTPAARKGAAIKLSRDLLERNTSVRFAPNDTGGQRQGLIAAMTDIGDGDGLVSDKDLVNVLRDVSVEKGQTISDLLNGAGDDDTIGKLNEIQIDTRDPRTMYIVAGELNSILGENNTQMLTFLQEMWDGGSYRYKLRNTQYEIKDGLLSILGGTTPSQIALSMPPEAIGQGFTSRVIFVFGDKQYARIARPKLDTSAGEEIGGILGNVFNRFSGPFEEAEDAAALSDELYMRGVEIKDPRFLHYADRRQAHLQKVSMALAAGRGEMIIKVQDVRLADQLLMFTENLMPDALGEYGMNKLGAAKQRLLDAVRGSFDAIPVDALYGLLSRDMSQMEFKTILVELHNAKKVTKITVDGRECVVAVDESGVRRSKKEMREIAQLMSGLSVVKGKE